MDKTLISISFGTMAKAALLSVVLIGAWYLRDVIVMVLLAIVIASAVEPAARWFTKFKIPRVFGVIIVYFATFFIFFLVFYFVIPPLLGEALDFVSFLPQFIDNLLSPESPIFSVVPSLPTVLTDSLKNFALELENFVPEISFGIASATSAIFG